MLELQEQHNRDKNQMLETCQKAHVNLFCFNVCNTTAAACLI